MQMQIKYLNPQNNRSFFLEKTNDLLKKHERTDLEDGSKAL